ncbi:MAG: response regulator transcription factor [Clostridiales bacterium]|nr:response regulator transcription factor [Clostridiales bacterium]
MYKVLIVDDHDFISDALTAALEATGEYSVVCKLSNAAYAETFCARLRPDLVLMDVCTDGGASGIAATRTLCELYPDIKIIVMSGFNEITYAPRAKEAGARAFVFKSRSLDYFIEVVRKVMRGEYCYPETKSIPMPVGETALTEREMEVLRLMCRNMTSREIAAELFISVDTVKYRKANMLAKTGFTKSVDLVFYVLSGGWINPMY